MKKLTKKILISILLLCSLFNFPVLANNEEESNPFPTVEECRNRMDYLSLAVSAYPLNEEYTCYYYLDNLSDDERSDVFLKYQEQDSNAAKIVMIEYYGTKRLRLQDELDEAKSTITKLENQIKFYKPLAEILLGATIVLFYALAKKIKNQKNK